MSLYRPVGLLASLGISRGGRDQQRGYQQRRSRAQSGTGIPSPRCVPRDSGQTTEHIYPVNILTQPTAQYPSVTPTAANSPFTPARKNASAVIDAIVSPASKTPTTRLTIPRIIPTIATISQAHHGIAARHLPQQATNMLSLSIHSPRSEVCKKIPVRRARAGPGRSDAMLRSAASR